MADHPNAAVVRDMLGVLDSGDMLSLSDKLADDIVWHEIGNPNAVRGKAALAEHFTGAGAPDYTIKGELHDVIANDDHTIALVSATATRGDKTLTYKVAEIYHVKDGKIAERWAFSDDTGRINEFFG